MGAKRKTDPISSSKWRAKNPGYQPEWRRKNPEKVKAAQRRYAAKGTDTRRKWEAANVNKRRGYHLKRRFGISLADYWAMHRRQRGLCGICGKPPTRRWLDVDHCHTTKEVRGLLCNPCNRSLGHIERYLAKPTRIDKWLRR